MRSLLLLGVALLASCSGEDDPMNAPPTGGGGGGGGGVVVSDAMASNSDAGATSATATLCLIEDLQSPTVCRTDLSLANILIEDLETGATATTDESGNFSIDVFEGTTKVKLKVGFADAAYKNAIVPIAVASQGDVPLFTEVTWTALLNANGAADPTASILAYATANGVTIEGIEMEPPSGTLVAPLYDGPGGPNDWISGGVTGPKGAALMLGVPIDSPNVSITIRPDSGLQTLADIPVLDGATTILVHETVQN